MSLRSYVWFLTGIAIGSGAGGFFAFTYAWLRAVGRI
jgi:hypothetical protein